MTQEASRFNLDVIEGLSFQVDQPDALGFGDWQAMQWVLISAFHQEIREHEHDPTEMIPEAAARYLVSQNLGVFMERRKDPSLAPRTEGQLFEDVQIVRAVDKKNGQLVAYSHSANNTSPPFAKAKMAIPPGIPVPKFGNRKYAKVSELAVRPDLRGNGIGTLVAYKTLSVRDPMQRVAAYVYDREFPAMPPALERHGMTRTGGETVQPYAEAENGGNTVLSRYAGRVGSLMRHIESLPDAREAIAIMNHNTAA